MNRRLLALVAAAAVLWPAAPAQAGPATPKAPIPVDTYLRQALDGTGLPGLSAVVTHGDEVVHAAGYGHDSTGAPVTARTPMRVASVSKSFTAMAVMTLVDAGKVALDEPVAEQLPEFRMADPRAARVTVRQLLDQTSGLADGGVGIPAAEATGSPAEYVAALRSGHLAAEPGTAWAYCNANYEIAARLVEVAGGAGFGQYVRMHVFEPLGMTGSSVGGAAADGHISLFGAWVARPELRAFGARGGAGGVVTDADDMGRWLITQTGHGPQLVRPESLAAMHAPSKVRDYAMGWGPSDVDGSRLLVHAGNLFTYTAVEAIDPATGYGYAVMTNSAGLYDDTYEVLRGLVALTRGAEPPPAGGQRQLIELVLGLVALASVGLAVLGVLRPSRRRWRLIPPVLPALVFVSYPQWVSILMNGRTVTWAQVTYFAAPLTVTLAVAALSGLVVAAAHLRSIASAR
ncbi:serine hydrolase domain-containing protein [Dactylosporangium sp. CA-139114]|uniref:serine hydrolase domain-containing protein n=1 Tax=Dactylosporangium sp. CA-139114 TaxID=3239931 RepID=UPI003D95CD55